MLPILDISSFLKQPGGPEAESFSNELTRICHEVGFFYLTGHGIRDQENHELLSVSRKFFALPEADRREIAIANSPHFRGYTILGDERTQGKRDWRDQIDIGPEEEAPAVTRDDPPWLRLRGPNQWPAKLPELRDVVSSWAGKMENVAMQLIRALAVGLGQDAAYFDDRFYPSPYTRIKISRYPGSKPDKDGAQGLGLHQDSGLFTFILQNDVVGLQVQRNGVLLDVEPLKGAFIVNLGEMFQAATNGFLKATKHQVKRPGEETERISIAYFMNPRLDAVFNPIPLPGKLAHLAEGGQNPDPDDPIYSVFGKNTLKIRMRSHPDVVANHYSDI